MPNILRAHICLKVSASFLKFSSRQSSRVIIVHNAEESSKTDDSLCSTLSYLLSKGIK